MVWCRKRAAAPVGQPEAAGLDRAIPVASRRDRQYGDSHVDMFERDALVVALLTAA
jgi:hypothetical protein